MKYEEGMWTVLIWPMMEKSIGLLSAW